jgi:hypothetical protein
MKSTRNFAYVGRTYFVGDEVPAEIAKVLDPSWTEKPKATKKSTHTNTPLEGE